MSGSRVARAFRLEGDAWMRHANAASVWTRFAVLPLLALAVWSRDWIGWWCLVPIALSLVWLAVNPLAFGPPRSTRNWASKSVFGERIWVEHDRSRLPAQFRSQIPTLLSASHVVGLVPLVYGLVVLDPVAAAAGILLIQSGKLWYLDRMVLLFEDVKSRDPGVAAWEYGPARRAAGRWRPHRGRNASAVGTGRPPGSAMP
jgi:hypothetical protein